MVLVVIYLRVSTEEQAKKGHSLPEQREACRAKAQQLAQQFGAPVTLEIQEFVDDFGGDVVERPVLEQVREFVRTHKVTHFICLDPDRFSRSLKWQLIVADEIESRGTRLVFVQQEYDPTDTMSRAFFQFRGLMSEVDKAKILERTARGKRGKIKSGGRPNGATPYGYIHVKATDQLEEFEPEATWVRTMFAWVVGEQIGIREVTRRLNALRVPTKRGGVIWYRSVVRDLLQNTSYIGEMRCNRRDHKGLGAISRLPREKRPPLTPKPRPKEEWLTVSTPAIVDRAVFEAAQTVLHTKIFRGTPEREGLFSLLAKCGECGGSMHYSRQSPSRTYLRCYNRYPQHYESGYSGEACRNPHHRVSDVEGKVWSRLADYLYEPEILSGTLAALNDDETSVREEQRLTALLETYRAKLRECQEEQAIIIRNQARRLLSESVADDLLKEATQQATEVGRLIAEAEAALTTLRQRAQNSAAVVERYADLRTLLPPTKEDLVDWLNRQGDDIKKQVLARAVSRIVVYADGRVDVVV